MKSKNIAESGILISLTMIILYATAFLPISTLSVLTISSCLTPICIIRNHVKNAFLVYTCSSILSLMIVPINISIAYILFFGIYGIVKYYIEKIHKLSYEIFLKLVTFNILFVITYYILMPILGINITLPYSLYIIWGFAQIIFLIYDYALTLIISIYWTKIHKLL